MKVIICGAGRVGSGIARHLAAENNDITVIDLDPVLVQRLQENLDVRGIVGHGAHPDILQRAGAVDADMLIAVTQSDETNMIATQVAHSLFTVPRKIARVRSQAYLAAEWQKMFSHDHMPIDVIISPEREVGKAVLRRLRVPGAFETVDFANGKVQMVGVRIQPGSPVSNTPLEQLRETFPGRRFTVMAISRSGRFFVPAQSDPIEEGDDVYFVAPREEVEATLRLFGHEEQEAHRVIIVGGGNIGVHVAKGLEKRHRAKVKLIERSKHRAEQAADELGRTVVLLGSGLDEAILKEASVEETETVVTLTNDDEVNILTSLMARKLGAKRTITLVNERGYGDLINSLEIGAFIDPRATTVSTILQYVRRGRIKGLHSIGSGAGEVIEAEALQTSELVDKPLGETKLSPGIVIGIIVRGNEIFAPDRDFIVRNGDQVVVFATREMVRKAEQMFRVSLEFFS